MTFEECFSDTGSGVKGFRLHALDFFKKPMALAEFSGMTYERTGLRIVIVAAKVIHFGSSFGGQHKGPETTGDLLLLVCLTLFKS